MVKPENVLVLQEIFSYHYTYGQVLAGELTNGQMITMANGKDININILAGGVVINENSAVVMSNVLANNGVIHAIDKVLIPPGLDVAGFLAECVAKKIRNKCDAIGEGKGRIEQLACEENKECEVNNKCKNAKPAAAKKIMNKCDAIGEGKGKVELSDCEENEECEVKKNKCMNADTTIQ